MTTIGIVVKPAPEALNALETVRKVVGDTRLLVEREGHHAVEGIPDDVERVSAKTFQEESDLVVVFGGDGTLIHAASLLPERSVPILGINVGYIGFLTEVALDEVEDGLQKALAGELPESMRMRLDVQLFRGSEMVSERRILNDTVLSQKALSRLAIYRIERGGKLVTTMRGDGVIVSTPTGSTAYALAAGGSILAPDMEAIAITPISPHQLTQRQLVVKPDADIALTLSDADSSVFVSFDGQAGQEFNGNNRLLIRRAPVPVRLLTVPWRSYFEMLRTKLRWGHS